MTDTAPTSKPEETCGKVDAAIAAAQTVFPSSWNAKNHSDTQALVYIAAAEKLPFNYGHLDTLITAAKKYDTQAKISKDLVKLNANLRAQIAALSQRPDAETVTKVREALDRGGFHTISRGHIEDGLFISEALTLLPTPPQPDKEG